MDKEGLNRLVCKPVHLLHLGKNHFPIKSSSETVFARKEWGDSNTTKHHLSGPGHSQTCPSATLEASGSCGSRRSVQIPSDFYHVGLGAFQVHLLPSLTYTGISKVKLCMSRMWSDSHCCEVVTPTVNETRLSLSCNNPKHSGSLPQLSSADLTFTTEFLGPWGH